MFAHFRPLERLAWTVGEFIRVNIGGTTFQTKIIAIGTYLECNLMQRRLAAYLNECSDSSAIDTDDIDTWLSTVGMTNNFSYIFSFTLWLQ